MLSFKPAFSLSSFTFIKRLFFGLSLLSAHQVEGGKCYFLNITRGSADKRKMCAIAPPIGREKKILLITFELSGSVEKYSLFQIHHQRNNSWSIMKNHSNTITKRKWQIHPKKIKTMEYYDLIENSKELSWRNSTSYKKTQKGSSSVSSR